MTVGEGFGLLVLAFGLFCLGAIAGMTLFEARLDAWLCPAETRAVLNENGLFCISESADTLVVEVHGT